MTKKPKINNRTIKGFTIIELVVVLAIISILMMVAIPAVVNMQRQLKSTEMEAAARQIYIATQNRLTVMKSAGTLDVVNPLSNTSLVSGTNPTLTWIEEKPADYDKEGEEPLEWTNKTLCYAINDGTSAAGKPITNILIPVGAVDNAVLQGYYVIEYNPSQGSVYGVFFAEESFNYEDADIRNADPRSSASLRDIPGHPIIGYYGGGGRIDTTGIEQSATASNFSIINDEKLFIRITPIDTRSYTVKIEAKDAPSAFATYTYTFNGNQINFIGNTNISKELVTGDIIILLDSLELNKHFSDFFTASVKPPIAPGSDIRITLSTKDIGASNTIIQSQTIKTTNSLFGGRTGNEASIAYGRHLQNLEPSISGVSGITSAVVTKEINWKAKYPSERFTAITNTELKNFDGNGNLLSNFAITPNGNFCGLFGRFGGIASSLATLSNVRLSDVTIYGGNANYVGTLAGEIYYTNISSCNTFLIPPISNANLTASAAIAAGGLVGTSSNSRYTSCFAALNNMTVNLAANSGIGGFIGISVSDTIISCYANTTQMTVTTSASTARAGGFAGRANSTASYSYALGNIKQTNGVAAGFWCASGGNAISCYSATTFIDTAAAVSIYGFSDRASTGCSYYSGAFSTPPPTISGTTARDLPGLRATYSGTDSTNWRTPTQPTSQPYNTILQNKTYPVSLVRTPTRTLPHYGNWPEAAVPIDPNLPPTPIRPMVAGEIMVYLNDVQIFEDVSVLLQKFTADSILMGGSLYVPSTAGVLSIQGNKTIDWTVSGNIILQSDIETSSANNLAVKIISQTGNIVMNGVSITGAKNKGPYRVNISAENGSIQASGAEIETKSDANGIISYVARNDIDISNAQLTSAGDKGVQIQSTAGSINAAGAFIESSNQTAAAVITLNSATSIKLSGAEIKSKSKITINAVESIDAQSASITNSQWGQDITVISSNDGINLSSTTISSGQANIIITAKEAIIAQSSSITNAGNAQNITITSSDSGIDLSSLATPKPPTLVSSSQGNIYITAKKDISIISAQITTLTTWGMELRFASTVAGSKLWVNAATVKGRTITATNLTITGTLASGSDPIPKTP